MEASKELVRMDKQTKFTAKDLPQATRAMEFIQLQLLELARDCGDTLKNGEVSPNSFVELQTQLEKILHETRAACKPPPRKPAMKDFKIIREVSRGAFGTVNLVWHIKTKTIYAMKQIGLRYVGQRDAVILERDMLTYLDHPLVVPMYCSFETVGQMYMTMEYVQGGDLENLLYKKRHFRLDMARFYMAELVLAVEYIHSYGILHGDLKPSNLLINKEGHIKLADFGLSKIGSVSTTAFMTEADCHRNAREFTDKEKCGTCLFMAPELYLETGYGKPVDWWAAGVILYNLLYGVLPFDGQNRKEVARCVTKDDVHFPDAEHPNCEFARHLITRLLEKDPVRRLGTRGANEVKRHPFFQGVNWKKLPYETAPYVPRVEKMPNIMCPSKLCLTSSDSDDDCYERPTRQTDFCTVAFRFNKVYGSPLPLSPCMPVNRRLLSEEPGDSEEKEVQQEVESDEEDDDDKNLNEDCLQQSGQVDSESDFSSPPLHRAGPVEMVSIYSDSDSDGEDYKKISFRLPRGRDGSQSDSAPTPPPNHAAPVKKDSENFDGASDGEDISNKHCSEASPQQNVRDESQCDSAPTPAPQHAAQVQKDSGYFDGASDRQSKSKSSEGEDISNKHCSEASPQQNVRDESQCDSAPSPAPHAAPVKKDSGHFDGASDGEDFSNKHCSGEASLQQNVRDGSQSDSAPTPPPNHAAPVKKDSENFDGASDGEDVSNKHCSEASPQQNVRDESQCDSAPTPAPQHAAQVQKDSGYFDGASDRQSKSKSSEGADISNKHCSEASPQQNVRDESQCDSAPSPAPHAAPVKKDSGHFDGASDGEDFSNKHCSGEASLQQNVRDERQCDSAPSPAPHAAPVKKDSGHFDGASDGEDFSNKHCSGEASLQQNERDESQCDSAPSPAPHHASPVKLDPVEESPSDDLLEATCLLMSIQLQLVDLARDFGNTLLNDLVRPNYFVELESQLVEIHQETGEACRPKVEDVSSEEEYWEQNSQGRWLCTQSPVLLKVSSR